MVAEDWLVDALAFTLIFTPYPLLIVVLVAVGDFSSVLSSIVADRDAEWDLYGLHLFIGLLDTGWNALCESDRLRADIG